MFPNSPGMVSSVMSGIRPRTPATSSSITALRTSGGSAWKLGALVSSSPTSGKRILAADRRWKSPPSALPMMTATRSGSRGRSGHP